MLRPEPEQSSVQDPVPSCALVQDSGSRLAQWDDFRTLKWIDEVKCPELVIKQVEELLQTATS